MLLTAVITTRNEQDNIANCIHSFDGLRDEVEVIVVDNASTDATQEIARSLGARVFEKGPERCAQRNLGWRMASSAWVVILDADMILPRETVEEMLAIARSDSSLDAYWVPEVRTGTGWRIKVRNFERSFYNATCIDALRLYRREVLVATGGYDESLIAGGEDWELDIRILATGAKCALMQNHLLHNEKQLSLAKMLSKKAYYAKTFDAYKSKWPDHPAVKKQFSAWYRFVGVFMENGKWRKVLAHPLLFAGVLFDRFAVGLVYLASRMGARASGYR